MNIYEINSAEKLIKGNPYVGRGIIAGLTEDGKNAAAAYFIMGRSENSRNRVFKKREDGTIYTAAFDEAKAGDPSLIIYNAIRKCNDTLIVTNGNQTDTIYDFALKGKGIEEALTTREFEPDAPNFTPRISAVLDFAKGFSYKMNILKSVDENGSACVRENFSYPAIKGLGHFIHTYVTDGNPIPTFVGEPERISIPNCICEFTDSIWNSLDESNKISLYVRYTSLKDGSYCEKLINKNV